MNAKRALIAILEKQIPHKIDYEVLIERPPSVELGDFALPCFGLAKVLKKNPVQIASELAETIEDELIERIEVKGAYLNFFLAPASYAQHAFDQEPHLPKERKRIMVEFSQANTHKPFHVGHLRNTSIGDALAGVLETIGHEVIRANYPGDIGTHVAKSLWQLQQTDKEPGQNKGKFLGKVYVEANANLEENPEGKEEVAKILQELEARKEPITTLWKETRQWSLDEFEKIYQDLGIHFDVWYYESEEDEPGKRIARELLEEGIAERSEGAVIVDLEEEGLGAALVLKSDGTTLYLTKDLSLAQRKYDDYKLDESLYIIDSRQSLHFKQFFAVLGRMGFEAKLVHVPYEFVSTKEGVIASRKGNVYLYEDLKARMEERVKAETAKRHEDWTDKQLSEAAHVITNAALKFGMLKVDMNTEIVFDEEEWLDFEGETGPYLLYTYARLKSILRKDEGESEADLSRLDTSEDKQLLGHLDQRWDVLVDAARQYKPTIVARYALKLAQLANEYYHKHHVLKAEPTVRAARVKLLESVAETLKDVLKPLGIETLEEM